MLSSNLTVFSQQQFAELIFNNGILPCFREYLSGWVNQLRVDIGTDSPRRFFALDVTFRSIRRLGALGPDLQHKKIVIVSWIISYSDEHIRQHATTAIDNTKWRIEAALAPRPL